MLRFKHLFYIFFIVLGLISKANGEKLNLNNIVFEDINGDIFSLKDVNSKLILIVNTASFCGFTKQYAHLQSLSEKYDLDQLLIIAIPSNDFGNQEPGSNKEIKDFCEGTYGIGFPIMAKQSVVGKNKHHFYNLIEQKYGTKFLPKWNFHKYLIKNDGTLIKSYSSLVSPLSKKLVNEINANL